MTRRPEDAGEGMAFWRDGAQALLDRLSSRPEGLTTAEATRRRQVHGPNSVTRTVSFVFLKRLGRKLVEPLVAILLAAAIVTGFTGDAAGATTIVLIVVVSIALDILQEHNAERAAAALRQRVAVRVDVRRNGAVAQLPAADLVPGDVVELRAGDLVPADGICIETRDLYANQALLTGEPYPAAKQTAAAQTDDPAEAENALFMGSSIVSGTGLMLVAATGGATRFGTIVAALAETEPPTAFEREMRRFGLLVLRLTAFLVLFVLLAHLAVARPFVDSFLFAVALAVGLTPELLPMIMTVTLARGALRLAKGGVIVKRLAALHDLGAMDVLCTDKTGTLTEARIALVGHVRLDGRDDDAVLRLAWLNAHFETGVRSPLDEAILARTAPADADRWTKRDEIPFDFARRRLSVLVCDGTDCLLVVKGAPEELLARSERFEQRDGSVRDLDTASREQFLRLHDDFARSGQRLLGIAWRRMPAETGSVTVGDEEGLVFAGFAVFVDPPKASAAQAVRTLAAQGVAAKILSGDNGLVVRHLAETLGFDTDKVLTGQEVAALSDEALFARVDEVSLFCRVDPSQKMRIIRALKTRRRTVGFLGDGVNDAPALKAADVGISVETAVDVAKQAADLVLTRPDLAMICRGVEEGRRTFANILKYVLMGTSSNFGNMLSMAAASLFLPFLPMLPIQILLNNLLYDISEIGIPFDRIEPDETRTPRRWDLAMLRRFTIVMGLLSSVFDLVTFFVLYHVFQADPATFRTAWFMESMATQILVIFIIRSRRFPPRSRAHAALVSSSLCALAVALLLPLTGFGAAFGFTAPPPAIVLALGLIVAAYLAAAAVLQFSGLNWPGGRPRGLSRR